MAGVNGSSGISWQQFVVVVLPLFISLLVAAFLISERVEYRLKEEINDNKLITRSMQNEISSMRSSLSEIKVMLKRGHANGYE